MIVYGTSRGYLKAIELVGDTYRDVWTSPSLVTRVHDVEAGNLAGDGLMAAVACNSRGTIFVYDLGTFSLRWQTLEGTFNSVEAIDLANIDSGSPARDPLPDRRPALRV